MRRHPILGTALIALGVAACDQAPVEAPTRPVAEADFASRAGPDVVNITAGHLEFITSVDELGSGWTTFRLKNRSEHTHFFFLQRLPVFEGVQITLDDYVNDLAKPFQNFMDFQIGRAPTFPEAGFAFPPWSPEVIGGTGLTAPGASSEVTVNLEPGLYVIECYVKTPDGIFHTLEGMVEDFTVTEKANASGSPPAPSVRLTLSAAEGITVEGSIERPGVHTVEVVFQDQAFYANFVQHDVSLVRLDPETDMEQLASWMDWRDINDPNYPDFGGLTTPAPATFLGGSQEGPAGSTAFFTVRLPKGDYAWIAELPRVDLLAGGAPEWIVPFSVD